METEETQNSNEDAAPSQVDATPVAELVNTFNESVQAAGFAFLYGSPTGKQFLRELKKRKPKSYDPDKPSASDTDGLQKGAYSEGYQKCLEEIESMCLERPVPGADSEFIDTATD